MALISLIAALLLEQWRPLSDRRYLFTAVSQYAGYFEQQFNAGETQQGVFAWMLAVLPLVLGTWLVYAILWHMNPLLALAFNIAALYVTMGFRQFSHYFTEIRGALESGDDATARRLLQDWTGQLSGEPGRSEMIRLLVVQSVVSAHRHVFGVFTWYSLGSLLGLGPAGAVVYRMGAYMQVRTGLSTDAGSRASLAAQRFARQMWWFLDWLPVRLTAMGFAFVGSFEESIELWRRWELLRPGDNDALLIAATSGAIGMQLAEPVAHAPGQGWADASAAHAGVSWQKSPQIGHLAAVVGLVWRTVVMWLVLLALMTLARLLG